MGVTRNVVIFGCPRSGTSIFLRLFEVLGWRCYFEPGFDFVVNSLQADKSGPWAIKNPIDRWVTPGLSCNLDDLDAVTKDKVFIWIVRHPLDTICSLRPGLEKRWAHPPFPRNWARLMGEPVDVRCAALWAWCNGLGYDMISRHHLDAMFLPGGPASKPALAGYKTPLELTIRYEDLIIDPRLAVEQVCSHTDMLPDPDKVDEFTRTVTKSAGVREMPFQKQWARPHHKHVDRWRENMSMTQVKAIRPILEDLPERFGYLMP